MSNELNFSDLSLIELPVTGPDGKAYILKEATGKAAKAYRNALMACTTLGPTGKPQSIRNLADVEPMLVGMCLFHAEEGKNKGQPVSQSTIENWPAKVVKALFEKIKEISGLDEEETTIEVSLKKLLKREGAPCTPEQLASFIKSLPDDVKNSDEFKTLAKAFEEEPSKNSSASTTDGSPSA